LPAGRIAALGATPDFHHGLPADLRDARAGSWRVRRAAPSYGRRTGIRNVRWLLKALGFHVGYGKMLIC
jgi:hypothetical protein